MWPDLLELATLKLAQCIELLEVFLAKNRVCTLNSAVSNFEADVIR